IVEDFEREVYGRVPENVPRVTWSVAEQSSEGVVGGIPVVGKRLVGTVDNAAYPAISVDIQMTLVTPKDAPGPVPVLMMFGGRNMELPAPADAQAEADEDAPPSRQEMLIAAG